MSTIIWLNGRIISPDDHEAARVSLFDAGIQHAVGLFETLRADHGRVHRLQQHLDRIEQSSTELRLLTELNTELIENAIVETVERSQLDHARIRLTITGGDLNMLRGSDPNQPAQPTIFIVTQPAVEYPDTFFETGVRVLIADGRLNPFDATAGHKSLNYWFRLRTLQEAATKRCSEAIWLSVSNHLMSGSVSNLFIVKDGMLLTAIARGEEEPGALPAPVLPGITRAAILEHAEDLHVEIRRQMLDINHLLEADEVFLTNSSWGILPVTAVETRTIGEGEPGPVTRMLRREWLSEIQDVN